MATLFRFPVAPEGDGAPKPPPAPPPLLPMLRLTEAILESFALSRRFKLLRDDDVPYSSHFLGGCVPSMFCVCMFCLPHSPLIALGNHLLFIPSKTCFIPRSPGSIYGNTPLIGFRCVCVLQSSGVHGICARKPMSKNKGRASLSQPPVGTRPSTLRAWAKPP